MDRELARIRARRARMLAESPSLRAWHAELWHELARRHDEQVRTTRVADAWRAHGMRGVRVCIAEDPGRPPRLAETVEALWGEP
jgi:hypothetical protein